MINAAFIHNRIPKNDKPAPNEAYPNDERSLTTYIPLGCCYVQVKKNTAHHRPELEDLTSDGYIKQYNEYDDKQTGSVNEHSSASNYLSDAGNHTKASRTNNDTKNNDNNTRGTTKGKTTSIFEHGGLQIILVEEVEKVYFNNNQETFTQLPKKPLPKKPLKKTTLDNR
eukprot:Pgem_evm1s2732